ncbi:hypothetical protein Tsubulata_044969 [Turnera subulata]|uniref:SEC7 domain-containing protein n=1 Tax=Turnera subulata TaxID=218843 RepID=A0A9Q0J368_9ROSI|nr:hypothetical protein Tsubulata_044969 [Turnera subulata]
MHLVVDAVTSCRFEVTDPASEEVVLMKILQVLLSCMKSKASVMLNTQHGCTIVNTCYRIVHQAGSKSELLQRISRHTMHELVKCIFSHPPVVENTEHALVNGVSPPNQSNVFEDLANLLSRSAFPVNCPMSAMYNLALDGLIAVIQGMAERNGSGSVSSEQAPVSLDEYTPFWMVKCDNYCDLSNWVSFVLRHKYIKRRLMIGADHFNRDTKKGLKFLQGTHLLLDKLDPQAYFFSYTVGLDKNLVGDFLGNHDEFCV